MNIRYYLPWLSLLLVLTGCQKWVEVDTPKSELTADKVFADGKSADAAVMQVYASFDQGFHALMNRYMASYTDDYRYVGGADADLEFQQSTVSPTNYTNQTIWTNGYKAIFECNQLIEQVHGSALNDAQKQRLESEAKFLRAFTYCYLINLYGNIPLVLSTDIRHTATQRQAPTTDIYAQIIKDLTEAAEGLPEPEVTDNVRASKAAAQALLARVYRYLGEWVLAEKAATKVIARGYELELIANVFLANSKETIFQFWTQAGYIAESSSVVAVDVTPLFVMTPELLAAFEDTDSRKRDWMFERADLETDDGAPIYMPYKYKRSSRHEGPSEYLVALRLAEQYLIRAEARAQQHNIEGAVSDLQTIQRRAGLEMTEAPANQSACLVAIATERQRELFGEWGARFFDLKSRGVLDEVMQRAKPFSWRVGISGVLPIPEQEITYNKNLIQNAGY